MILTIFLFILFSFFNFSENVKYPQNYFSFPIKGEIEISGNFGEIRLNHFHAGLDFRTGKGEKGTKIYASADGFISRINISTKGYGKALYIVHPNGFTTVYGHLGDFNPAINKFTDTYQYQSEVYETEIYPEKYLLKVKKGDLIAISGNTGGSGGPHLHFEIRNTASEETIDPMLFGLKIKDVVKPKINSIIIYRLDSSNKALNGTYNFLKIENKNKNLNLPKGLYALGIECEDYLKNNGFRMGLNSIKLFLNNKLYFEQKIEKLRFDETRIVNSHIDYAMFDNDESKIVKLFIDNGNTLKIYPTAINKGKFLIGENENVKIKIVVSDYSNNKDSVTFLIQNNLSLKKDIPKFSLNNKLNKEDKIAIFYPEKSNFIENESHGETLAVKVPNGTLFDTVLFSLGFLYNKQNGENIWQIMRENIPLKSNINISFKTPNPNIDSSKVIILRIAKDGKYKVEKTTKNGSFYEANIKYGGKYFLSSDTAKPQISNLKINENEFMATISDQLSGIKEYQVKIDDKWVLAYYEPKENLISGRIPDFVKCGIHNFSIKVTDFCSNSTSQTQTFTLINCLNNMKLKTGDKAPNFETQDQNGNTVKLSDLKNSKLVLYFYPKDDTPGCTAEACNLRDNYEMLLSKGFKIYGVSPDGIKQHIKFKEKYNLPFDLLTDEDHIIAEAYGTWVEKSMYGRNYMGMARVTFIIENGIITDIIDKVDTKNHASQILK